MVGIRRTKIDNPPDVYLAVVGYKIEKGARGVHIQALKFLNTQAEAYFRDRLGPPYAKRNRRSVSGTLGHRTYRPESRGTGKYTFGGRDAAFHGNLIQGKNPGFGYPNIRDANVRTKNSWRALEFGLPASQHRMPKYIWADASGKTSKKKGFSGTELVPLSRNTPRFGSGITAKRFLKDAWDDTMKTMPERYSELIVNAFAGSD